jgi:hypothetical protein
MPNKRKSEAEIIVLDSDAEETPKKATKNEDTFPLGINITN